MARRLISSGSDFERRFGYSRAVVDGDFVFVAGTTGFDYRAMTIAPGAAAQTRQTFVNIAAALAEADASLADVVRVRYYVPNPADWRTSRPFSARSWATSGRPRPPWSAGWSIPA